MDILNSMLYFFENLIGELPQIDMRDFSFASISGATWVTIGSVIIAAYMIISGYRNGVIVELSSLISLLSTFVVLRMLFPVIRTLITGDLTGFARIIVFGIIAVLIFTAIQKLINIFGKMLRKIPLLGLASGILGAAVGAVEALIVLLIIQMTTGIDVLGAIMFRIKQISGMLG